MTEEKRFKVLAQNGVRVTKNIPETIRWTALEPFRKQAMSNHGQTLERLNERGGLSPAEIYAVCHGLSWGDRGYDDEQAIEFARGLV